MKRICVALSILCLFSTSIFGHPNCCFSVARDCPARPSTTEETDCCSHKKSPQPVSQCNNANQSGCHTQKSVKKCLDTTGAEDYGNTKDCKKMCFSLLPPLLADGPSRSTLPNSDGTESDIITQYILLSSSAGTKTVDNNSPCGIHPGITTIILRI